MDHQSDLFVTSKGFPMSFFLQLSLCDAEVRRIKKIIMKYGGMVVHFPSGMDGYTIHLVDDLSVNQFPFCSPMFFYRFIDDCVAKGELLDLNNYLAYNVPAFADLDFNRVVLERVQPMRQSKIKDLKARCVQPSRRRFVLTTAATHILHTDGEPDVVKEYEPVSRAPYRRPRTPEMNMELDSDGNGAGSPSSHLDKTVTQPLVEDMEMSNTMSPIVSASPTATRAAERMPDELPAVPTAPAPGPSCQGGPSTERPEVDDTWFSDASSRRGGLHARVSAELQPPPEARHVRERNFNTRNPYSEQERRDILKYLISLPRSTHLRGNRVWKDLEELRLFPSRSFQSLKNHFLKFLVRDLDKYSFLSESDKRWLRLGPES